jgi:1-acyl-sn-glycerol-3-phosphate acyltransferase
MKDWPRWRRRLVTVPAVLLLWAVVLLLSPLLLPVALVVDALRATRGVTPVAWRLILFLLVYLTAEGVALLACLVIWIGSGFGALARLRTIWTYRIQLVWANLLWMAAETIFGLRLDVTGESVAAPGPVVVLSRHASMVDTILPFQLFTRRERIWLRYVLKRELLVDPSLDIAGNWLPNHFVQRAGTDSDGEIEALRQLARDMGQHDGIVIFPEGTRFTSRKQERSFDILRQRNPRFYELARGLRHLMPPRPSGALAIMEEARADVVVVAHHGLDGFASVGDIWSGGMVGKKVQVRLTRYPFAEIPAGRTARTEWIFARWQELDDWLAERIALGVTSDG